MLKAGVCREEREISPKFLPAISNFIIFSIHISTFLKDSNNKLVKTKLLASQTKISLTIKINVIVLGNKRIKKKQWYHWEYEDKENQL